MRVNSIEWAAGLFEGEGCIYEGKQSKFPHNPYYQLTVGMTDKDVVQKFCDVVGYGHVTESKTKTPDHWKQVYTWRAAKTTEVRRILSAMLPYFGNRRAYKALNILDTLELTP